jgi:hypothetical protein
MLCVRILIRVAELVDLRWDQIDLLHLFEPHAILLRLGGALHFAWKLFASHEIKILLSGDRAIAEGLLLATGRFHDVVANEIE